MRTLRIISLLLGIVTSLTFLQAANAESRNKLAFRTKNTWKDRAEKSLPFISIEAYIVNNNCIEVLFFGKGDTPSTFQIKDSQK